LLLSTLLVLNDVFDKLSHTVLVNVGGGLSFSKSGCIPYRHLQQRRGTNQLFATTVWICLERNDEGRDLRVQSRQRW
jgi:hypothetical protein